MPLNKGAIESLKYLRKRYNVSESDLLAIAKTLNEETSDDDDWERRMQEYLVQRKRQHAPHRKR
jgi:hypothetical protein